MLVINKVLSPENTADGRIILHLYEDEQKTPYEASLTLAAAYSAVSSLLWAIGNLPGEIQESSEVPITTRGEAELGVSGEGMPVLQLRLNGLGLALDLDGPGLARLKSGIEAFLGEKKFH